MNEYTKALDEANRIVTNSLMSTANDFALENGTEKILANYLSENVDFDLLIEAYGYELLSRNIEVDKMLREIDVDDLMNYVLKNVDICEWNLKKDYRRLI